MTPREQPRSGRSALGCLFLLAIGALVVYIGINAGSIYYRYWAYSDVLKTSARFASTLNDAALRSRIGNAADSLGMPYGASAVNIQRVGRTISITGDYTEVLDLRVWKHVIRFKPSTIANY